MISQEAAFPILRDIKQLKEYLNAATGLAGPPDSPQSNVQSSGQ